MLIDHQEAAMWHISTIFCGAQLKKSCYGQKSETIEHLKVKTCDSIGSRSLVGSVLA